MVSGLPREENRLKNPPAQHARSGAEAAPMNPRASEVGSHRTHIAWRALRAYRAPKPLAATPRANAEPIWEAWMLLPKRHGDGERHSVSPPANGKVMTSAAPFSGEAVLMDRTAHVERWTKMPQRW